VARGGPSEIVEDRYRESLSAVSEAPLTKDVCEELWRAPAAASRSVSSNGLVFIGVVGPYFLRIISEL